MSLFAAIPSPSSGSIELGPLRLNAYGLMIAAGVVAAVWIAGRRLERSGAGTRDDVSSVAVWAVPAGVVGARLYHVITDWDRFSDRPGDVVRIWEGGLGIPGGIAAGVIVGWWATRRRGVAMAPMLTAVAPAIPVAQAIGRWGNWFNQELFGRPTSGWWALEVSDSKAAAAGYPPGTTFHPTFLYESLWNLGLAVALIAIERRFRIGPGRLFAWYVAGYALGRFWVEGLRIDEATEWAGLRLNQWTAILVGVAAIGFLVIDRFRQRAAGSSEMVGPRPESNPGEDLAESALVDDGSHVELATTELASTEIASTEVASSEIAPESPTSDHEPKPRD